MNKEQEIRDIKEQQRVLADRLEALEKEEAAPKAGTVRGFNGITWLVDNHGCLVQLDDGWRTAPDPGRTQHLGTFDEVFIRREDAVSKEELSEALLSCGQGADSGPATRLYIADLFNIEY